MNKYFVYLLLSLSIMPWGILSEIPVQTDQVEESVQNRVIRPKVAVIYLIDPIDFKKTTLNLIDAAKSNDIQGIILVIHSFGGESDLFSGLHDTIKEVATLKPVVALISGSALSGGYLIASAANYVIANSGSEIGNIGVIHIVQRYRDAEIMSDVKAKLEVEVFNAGKFKGLGNTYAKELSTDERKYIKERLTKVYEQFLKTIIRNRKVSSENYKLWAEGQWFLSAEAVILGLIDKVGTWFDAEKEILARISTRNPGYLFDTIIEPIFFEPAVESKK